MSRLLESVSQGRVLRLFLNRPHKRNALNSALCADLVDALERADADSAVGAILLSARGKSFCAGMDLAEIAAGGAKEINALHERLFTIGSRLTKPLIAAVNGAALGGGTGLVANCHIVIAAEDAAFGLTEIRLGLWPFLVYRAVSAALGDRRTLEMALTGRTWGAVEARAIGFVHEIAPNLDQRAMEVAESVAAFSPTAIQNGLHFVHDVRGQDWETTGWIARRFRDHVFASEDFQEGIRAFQEKRPPRWPSMK